MRSVRAVFAVGLLLALLASCAAERTLVITSDPPGALVRLDDTIVGTTPYTQRFDDYGTRRITLYREGYRTTSKRILIEGPWYAQFPLDLISEVLLPFGWKDRHAEHITLEPESGAVSAPDLNEVLERAEALRLAEPTGPRPSTRPPTGRAGPAQGKPVPVPPVPQPPISEPPGSEPPVSEPKGRAD
jgi:hypothetical protein